MVIIFHCGKRGKFIEESALATKYTTNCFVLCLTIRGSLGNSYSTGSKLEKVQTWPTQDLLVRVIAAFG